MQRKGNVFVVVNFVSILHFVRFFFNSVRSVRNGKHIHQHISCIGAHTGIIVQLLTTDDAEEEKNVQQKCVAIINETFVHFRLIAFRIEHTDMNIHVVCHAMPYGDACLLRVRLETQCSPGSNRSNRENSSHQKH